MTCVVVLSDDFGKVFFDGLARITEETFSPLTVWQGHAKVRGSAAGLFITDRTSFRRIDIAPRILICVGEQRHSLLPLAASRSIVIVDSCEQSQLECVSETGLPAITCGLFRTDTITLSSSTHDSAVISLQRSIICHDGKICEPQEIPVKLAQPVDNYLLMAAAAVFLLSGNGDKLKEI